MIESEQNATKKCKVLFVCVGNSCRSPMAESILKNMISRYEEFLWEIDSAGLRSWNEGYLPEDRCLKVLAENGLSSDHIGRQITLEDFSLFDFIFGMDDQNIQELKERKPPFVCESKIQLLGDYYQEGRSHIIVDPYFEVGCHGFYRCYDEITQCCANFIKQQKEQIKQIL